MATDPLPQPRSTSVRWAVFAALTIGLLALVAPSGLLLLGFLAVVIGVHEGGHFLMARRVGIRPTEFCWGFGPTIVSTEIGGCRYGIRAFFLGGFVRLEGMTPSSEIPDGFPEAATFRAASPLARFLTVAAGPVSNIGLAVVAFGLADLVDGGSLVAAANAAVGSTVEVVAATGQAFTLLASNVGAYVTAVFDPSGGSEAPVRFLSPVAQAQISSQALALGPGMALRWLGVLSAAIAIVNALPLPPLDGGHAAVAVADGVVGRVRGRSAKGFDATKLVPLAYVTVGVLVLLSASALVLDLRDLA